MHLDLSPVLHNGVLIQFTKKNEGKSLCPDVQDRDANLGLCNELSWGFCLFLNKIKTFVDISYFFEECLSAHI